MKENEITNEKLERFKRKKIKLKRKQRERERWGMYLSNPSVWAGYHTRSIYKGV